MTQLSAAEAARTALAAIDRTEASVRAWEWLDRDLAIQNALSLDAQVTDRSAPLHGCTVGVKDIFEVAGMPTVAGFEPFRSRQTARSDSAVTHKLREAGALVLGKTVTTQFAVGDPPVTRNPWNLDRTPGGSSSGSAAAVAAGHVDLAIGSQTTGSTLRPAAFCGVYGLKPSFGWASRAGMVPLANSLDHVGLIGRSLAVVAAGFAALIERDSGPERFGGEASGPPRFGIWRETLSLADPEIREAVLALLERLKDNGAIVVDIAPFAPYERIYAVQQVIFGCEGAAVHRALIARRPDDYSPKVRAFVEVGSAIPAHVYVRAQALREELRDAAATAWTSFDAIVLPTAGGAAPTRETTGDTTLQAAATLFGLPAVSLPGGLARDGLPWGVQLIGPRHGETARLLAAARWIDDHLPRLPAPTGITLDRRKEQ